MNLLDNQKDAITKLEKYKIGALFMSMGTGKTLSAIELIKSIGSDYILWFCPFGTKENLKDELNKWGFSADVQGIESIQNSDRLYLEIYNKLQNAKNPIIIVDESLKIKNADAKRTKRILELSRLAEYKLILNGTPLSRNMLDLYSQMEFLSPKILGMTCAQFKDTFCEYKTISITKGRTRRQKEFIVKYHNLGYLYSLIEPFIFECELNINKNKQYHNLKYNLSDKEKQQHERIKKKILDNEWLMMKPNFFLEICQKLQNNYSRNDSKFELIRPLIDNKTIIFAKFIETQEKLREVFPDTKILSYQKHAFGLNLQDYNKIIFFDKTWDYAIREQAEARIYRTGQQKDCIFYDLTADVGLDIMIESNIYKKANMLETFKKLSKDECKKL